MVVQTFSDTPRRHAAAAVIALIPQVADFVFTQVNSTLQSAGIFQVTAEVEASMIESGVLWGGLPALKYGSIITSMLWAAILAFIIDRQLIRAAVTSFACAAFSFFGLMHSETLGINMGPKLMIGYLVTALIFVIYHYAEKKKLIDVPRRFDYV